MLRDESNLSLWALGVLFSPFPEHKEQNVFFSLDDLSSKEMKTRN